MATDAFDNWINGFPVITRDNVTRGFDYWLNGWPQIDEGLIDPATSTGAFTFDAMTIVATGTVLNPVTGTVSFTFADMTVTATGDVLNPVTGTANFTFDDMTVAATGVYSVQGSVTITFDDMTVAAAGTVSVQGSVSITFDDMGVVATGDYTPATAGTVTITFDDMVVVADGQLVIDQTGTGSVTFANMTISAVGEVLAPVTGTVEVMFDGLSLTIASGEVSNPGDTQDYPDMPAPLIGHRRRFLTRSTSTKMESERMRVRRMFPDPLPLFEVQWGFTYDQFETFKTWFEDDLRNGQNPFFLSVFETLDDTHFIREVDWVLAFMGPYSWSGSDNSFIVTATLEVIERVVLPETIANPTNPPPEESLVPELEYTFEGFPCREMFHLKASALETLKAHTLEIGPTRSGPWRPHVYFIAPGDGEIDFIFNNDYNHEAWFRIKRDHDGKVARRPSNPEASFIKAPEVEISFTTAAPGQLWGDLAYNQSSPSNQRINPGNAYYIVPRGRVMSNSGPHLDPEPTPRVVSITGDPGTISTWTRDNTDPEETTAHPDYDGVANNIAVQRSDFRYAVRARSFVPAGCKSPITLILVDKAVWQRPYTRAHGSAADESDVCDLDYTANVRTDWGRDEDGNFTAGLVSHTFISGDTCDAFAPDMRSSIIDDCRGGSPGLSETLIFTRTTTFSVAFNRIFLGSGDGGDHYTGWDQQFVVCSCFHAETITIERNALYWDLYPKCYTNSALGLGVPDDSSVGQYIVSTGESDIQVMTGPLGTEHYVQLSWGYDSVAVAGTTVQPINHVHEVVTPVLNGEGDGEMRYNVHIILTLHNDIYPPTALPDLPPAPAIPVIPFVAPVNIDTFEEYPTYDAELIFYMDRGSGWFAGSRWSISTIARDYGFETFETYGIDPNHPAINEPPTASGLTAGDGFSGEWTIKTTAAVIGLDTFQGYQKAILNAVIFANFDVSGLLGSGSGQFGYAGIFWDGYWTIRESSKIYGRDTFEAETLGVINDVFHIFDHGFGWDIWWTIGDTFAQIGTETWESYAEFSPADESNQLSGGTRWETSSYWKFRSAKTYGLDTFELYATGNFTTGQSGPNWAPSSAWTIETI